ncbi:TetR/AcrR family transcriptional regulator [Amycolatopsis sp. OK19-0408]|uniref:TetR/AcrR family transcriptional regulator n=1 Tax=Amycolatopsis iheyensis TaxID=2945988 RepID=A0A9X2NIF0_9PSEU|nr:helix-turn-helix domain-containing protein [Amycolatopsis iheyensis]MCR6487280.1 TetR/AcrR family transcriptional regulator [Amycolatopsis iheyensis]
MAGRRTDTRERIQRVALELFAEQGYEASSLREIAERLNVTKAALYYHFRTKEDIVTSLLEDWGAALDDLLERESRPAELLTAYAGLVESRFGPVMGLVQRNTTALKAIAAGAGLADRMIRLHERLCGGSADPEVDLRARLALVAVQLNSAESGPGTSPEVALAVGLDILSPGRNPGT